VIEDQVTYPLTTAMMGIPHAKVVRASACFETSMIYVISRTALIFTGRAAAFWNI